jgi:hydroxymethylpyrimidine/phosphomethylpyrimidine kinase
MSPAAHDVTISHVFHTMSGCSRRNYLRAQVEILFFCRSRLGAGEVINRYVWRLRRARFSPVLLLGYSSDMDAPPVILSIAGHDPSSGAGVTADVKTAAALGCYAVTCITALTVQSTRAVASVEPVKPWLVSDNLKVLDSDLPIAGIRIGMLGLGAIAAVVADFLEQRRFSNVILDPVIRSSSGMPLIDDEGVEVIRRRLLPLCDVVTPNVDEAAVLTGSKPIPSGAGPGYDEAAPRLLMLADELHQLGSSAVVITGGHLDPPNDLLTYVEDGQRQNLIFPGSRIVSRSTHGTGCAFATALACELAVGHDLPVAVRNAKAYVRSAIEAAYPLGNGIGPMNHLFRLKD